MKKALIIGIDGYPQNPLSGCVNDAVAVNELLERNGDGSPNFSTRLLTSSKNGVTCGVLEKELQNLFSGRAETALLYFAGHGLTTKNGESYIVAQDGKQGAWGPSLNQVLSYANNAHPDITSSIIILDCCYAGNLGEVPSLGAGEQTSTIGNGVTILTACHRSEGAAEYNGHGLFTGILIDSLGGSASDILGRITPASVYSHVDQILGPWEQRPIYKANVQSFITLRQVEPKIPGDVLRRLPTYFQNPSDVFPLDPSFEPDREHVPKEFKHLPVNDNNVKVFKELQLCNRHGLIVPYNAEHMFYAAIHSTGCKLTALGAHYRKLAEAKRI
ncbi:MAG: caspase family protein [Rhodospirillales bacterium]|nr:caspase family protein [Rhodospirillales bacterium]